MIVQHIKRRRGGKVIKVGTMIGTTIGDKAVVSFSKCRVTGDKCDNFNANEGINIAEERANLVLDGSPVSVPVSIKSDLEQFISRANRYFQDRVVVTPLAKHLA